MDTTTVPFVKIDSGRVSFGDLPFEVRNMIYKAYFAKTVEVLCPTLGKDGAILNPIQACRREAAALRTSSLQPLPGCDYPTFAPYLHDAYRPTEAEHAAVALLRVNRCIFNECEETLYAGREFRFEQDRRTPSRSSMRIEQLPLRIMNRIRVLGIIDSGLV